jgi:hypothetical protein
MHFVRQGSVPGLAAATLGRVIMSECFLRARPTGGLHVSPVSLLGFACLCFTTYRVLPKSSEQALLRLGDWAKIGSRGSAVGSYVL